MEWKVNNFESFGEDNELGNIDFSAPPGFYIRDDFGRSFTSLCSVSGQRRFGRNGPADSEARRYILVNLRIYDPS
jgi:hypothetical protein